MWSVIKKDAIPVLSATVFTTVVATALVASQSSCDLLSSKNHTVKTNLSQGLEAGSLLLVIYGVVYSVCWLLQENYRSAPQESNKPAIAATQTLTLQEPLLEQDRKAEEQKTGEEEVFLLKSQPLLNPLVSRDAGSGMENFQSGYASDSKQSENGTGSLVGSMCVVNIEGGPAPVVVPANENKQDSFSRRVSVVSFHSIHDSELGIGESPRTVAIAAFPQPVYSTDSIDGALHSCAAFLVKQQLNSCSLLRRQTLSVISRFLIIYALMEIIANASPAYTVPELLGFQPEKRTVGTACLVALCTVFPSVLIFYSLGLIVSGATQCSCYGKQGLFQKNVNNADQPDDGSIAMNPSQRYTISADVSDAEREEVFQPDNANACSTMAASSFS